MFWFTELSLNKQISCTTIKTRGIIFDKQAFISYICTKVQFFFSIFGIHFEIPGLQLILNAETYKYNRFQRHNPPEWKGVVVKVHPQNTEAIVEEGGVIAGTNTISRLGIKQVKC